MSVVILEGAPFITRMSIHECTKGALIWFVLHIHVLHKLKLVVIVHGGPLENT